MGIHGYTWVYMSIHGYTWVYMGIHVYTWVYMGIHEYTWVYMSIHGYTWVYMSIHEYTWVYMCIHEHTWVYMSIYGYTWVASNVPGVLVQAVIWLEITTWLASEINHRFGYILYYLELSGASIGTIWLCSICVDWKSCHSCLPPLPTLHFIIWLLVALLKNDLKLWTVQLPVVLLCRVSLLREPNCVQAAPFFLR